MIKSTSFTVFFAWTNAPTVVSNGRGKGEEEGRELEGGSYDRMRTIIQYKRGVATQKGERPRACRLKEQNDQEKLGERKKVKEKQVRTIEEWNHTQHEWMKGGKEGRGGRREGEGGQLLLRWRARVSTFKRDPRHILEDRFAGHAEVSHVAMYSYTYCMCSMTYVYIDICTSKETA